MAGLSIGEGGGLLRLGEGGGGVDWIWRGGKGGGGVRMGGVCGW